MSTAMAIIIVTAVATRTSKEISKLIVARTCRNTAPTPSSPYNSEKTDHLLYVKIPKIYPVPRRLSSRPRLTITHIPTVDTTKMTAKVILDTITMNLTIVTPTNFRG
ncbi:hypothetical protein RRF57_000571 [Xylaria bambusicola]|uniref:Uncharacterized protein n=1 Tax=Xylaria bambusicola TaxID=326684 RepID=A0AAN7U3S6_9PEZI